MGQHGQRLNTGTCYSHLRPFYDKRIYKKLRLKELSLSDPLYHGKKQHRLIGHVVIYIVLIKGGASERCDFSQFGKRQFSYGIYN
jgi:hypothetical protein